MGKLKKLRCRFISSIVAVKRSVLRRQSQGSTASNSTTLTGLDEADLPPAATSIASRERNRRLIIRRKIKKGDGGPSEPAQKLQLHWSEARRIYSEPMQTIDRVSSSRGEASNGSSTSTTVTDCRSLSCGAVPSRFPRSGPSLSSVQALASNSAGGAKVAACSLFSDEEENDDVFLESWEVNQGGRGLYLNTITTLFERIEVTLLFMQAVRMRIIFSEMGVPSPSFPRATAPLPMTICPAPPSICPLPQEMMERARTWSRERVGCRDGTTGGLQ